MSCLGNCYLPRPPRAWSRVQSQCTYPPVSLTSRVFYPPLDRYVTLENIGGITQLIAKGNVLQYKANSSNLTKSQVYSKIAKSQWTNRTTTWATQSDIYTNPNTNRLKRVNGINITLDGTPTSQAITCPQSLPTVNNILPANISGSNTNPIIPPPPPPPSDPGNDIIPIVPIDELPSDIVIPDLGNLICNIQEDPCTGEVIIQPSRSNFHPTTDSDVPGRIEELFWSDRIPTWYPRERLTMNNSTDKWPINATLFPVDGSCNCAIQSPTNLQVSDITFTTSELNWDEPIETTFCNAVRYIVTYQQGSPT